MSDVGLGEIVDLLTADAPRLFAVVQEVGNLEDAWVAAWGLAFEDHVEVVGVDGDTRMSLSCAETARHIIGLEDGGTAHLVWLGPRSG